MSDISEPYLCWRFKVTLEKSKVELADGVKPLLSTVFSPENLRPFHCQLIRGQEFASVKVLISF